jgi:hypothetical protein
MIHTILANAHDLFTGPYAAPYLILAALAARGFLSMARGENVFSRRRRY